MAKYWANVEWFDETVGQLLSHLEQNGLARNPVEERNEALSEPRLVRRLTRMLDRWWPGKWN